MKTFLNKNSIIYFLLTLLIISENSFAQTYKQYPINGEARYPISNLAVYNEKVAIIGRRNYENELQVYLYQNNTWKSLPMKTNVDGVESYIPWINNVGPIKPKIQFDNYGTIWVVGVNGLYNFENEKWIRYHLPNVNQETTTYQDLVFDKNGIGWAIISEIYGTGDNSVGGLRLYKFIDGKFYRHLEEFADFPLENEFQSDVLNSTSLSDGIILFGDKRYLGMNESGNLSEIIYINSDGASKFMDIPLIDKPIYSASLKKLNRIYVDSKNQVWFLMRFQQAYNQNTGVETACCSGIARLDNTTDWYTYTQENNTPYSMNFNDQNIRYATPVDMCELKNNEYLFVMQNNGYTEAKNLQLYKLNSENKFDTIQWKSYLENAIVYRPDYSLISEEDIKREINKLFDEVHVTNKLKIMGMKTDMYGNIWVYGENFIIKMTDDPTTSVYESIKKPTVIYPNPGNKSIRLSNSEESIVQIDVVSLLGENVLSIQKDFESINVSSLPIGFYMVKIKRVDGSVEYVKYNKN